jgi:hypothetical protein
MEMKTVMYCATVEDARECIEDDTTIFPLLERALVDMWKTGSASEEVLEIRCIDVAASMWVTLRRSEMPDVWKRVIAWRSGRDEWEELSVLKAAKEFSEDLELVKQPVK